MAGKDESGESQIQGEGDYEAARRYRDKTKKFIDTGRVESAARDAAPDDAQDEADMEAAEKEGLRHRKS